MTAETLDYLFGILADEFNSLLEGKRRDKNLLGEVLEHAHQTLETQGFTGACIQIKGDWEFLNQALKVPRWDNVDGMCWLCSASNSNLSCLWTSDAWKHTLKSHEDYIADLMRAGSRIPILFLILSLRIEGIMVDTLHAVELGIASHILANAIYEVMRLGHWGSNLPDQLAGFNSYLLRWYKRHPEMHRVQGAFTMERLKVSGDWPKLKVKAAATRHMSYFVMDMLDEFTPSGTSTHFERVRAVCSLLCRFYTIIHDEGQFLSASAKSELYDLSGLLRGIYVNLSREALHSGVKLWKCTGKLHLFEHLCQQQTSWGNPTGHWLYIDEDLQRICAKLGISAHINTMDYSVLYKWLVLVFD